MPNFLAAFLRDTGGDAGTRLSRDGEESEAWGQAVATLEDLIWSVQPKRSTDERRQLVALLPSLLKRLSAGMQRRAVGGRRSGSDSCRTWWRRMRLR